MFKTDLPGDGFEMAVLGCRSLVIIIIISIQNSLNDLRIAKLLNYSRYWKYRIYWPSYLSKHLYVKPTGHETHDKIATITGSTLGLKSH